MDVLIINGAPDAGKSTFTKILNQVSDNRVCTYSSIDWVKEIAGIMGWDGVKDERGRQFLYDIKQAAIAYDDIPLEKVLQKINKCLLSGKFDFVCVDIREPLEIAKLKKYLRVKQEVNCYSIIIRNTKAEERLTASGINNLADRQTQNIIYDIEIQNDGNKEEFQERIITAIDSIEWGEIAIKDEILFNMVDFDLVPNDKIHFNSDEYQQLIDNHYAELPKPVLSQDSIMLMINALALCGEAGEIANAIKKIVWYRNGDMTQDDILHIRDEIGDNLYHSAQLATITKSKLSDILSQSALKCINRGKQGFTHKKE